MLIEDIIKNYKYKDLIEDLRIGHEIEFEYEGDKYAIVNRSIEPAWYISKNNKLYTSYWDNPVDMVTEILIDGKSLKEIFDNGLLDLKGFYIL
ncbi:MAG: hypothetical protein SOY70_00555 [Veillonellaceae bacterium]|nr:hypothetical protein [Veillonellaceae bacterium]